MTLPLIPVTLSDNPVCSEIPNLSNLLCMITRVYFTVSLIYFYMTNTSNSQ